MKCPHCLVNFHMTERSTWNYTSKLAGNLRINFIGEDVDGYWWLEKIDCPACERIILRLICSSGAVATPLAQGSSQIPDGNERVILVRPRVANRPPVPLEVPPEFAKDYIAACVVIADSPEASAALSRRCLQQILRDKAQVQQPNNLAKAIEEVVRNHRLPTDLADSLDVVRNIGNFGAIQIRVCIQARSLKWSLEKQSGVLMLSRCCSTTTLSGQPTSKGVGRH